MQKIGTKIFIIATVVCIATYIGIFIGRVSVESPFESNSQSATDNVQDKQSKYTLNLNTADYDSLMELPGMNKELAEEIILYRQTYGKFIAVKELLNLEYMTDEIYSKIRNLVQIGGAL